MSTRMLVWNIEQFSLNKIQGQGDDFFFSLIGNTVRVSQYSLQKLSYILSNVRLKDPNIFVVIEVSSGMGTRGSLIDANGALGSQLLLTKLREINPAWCLVPPLKLVDKLQIGAVKGYQQVFGEKAKTEGISVYFRSDELDFVGPYIWPKAKDPNDIDPDTVAVPAGGSIEKGPYPDAWQSCLPANNYYAGQYEFFTQLKKLRLEYPYLGARAPFLVQFEEKHNTGAGRLLSLYCVHFPAKKDPAIRGLATLTDYVQRQVLENDEIVMVLGDLNVNKGGNPSIGTVDKSKTLTAAFNSKSNLTTSMYVAKNPTPKLYLRPDKLLDNVLYRLGADLMQVDVKTEIIDRVTNNSLMLTALPTILALPDANLQNKMFNKYLNFGQIGSPGVPTGASDHLALYFEV